MTAAALPPKVLDVFVYIESLQQKYGLSPVRIETMAKHFGKSRRQVTRDLRVMEARGWVTQERRFRSGRERPSVYHLHRPEQFRQTCSPRTVPTEDVIPEMSYRFPSGDSSSLREKHSGPSVSYSGLVGNRRDRPIKSFPSRQKPGNPKPVKPPIRAFPESERAAIVAMVQAFGRFGCQFSSLLTSEWWQKLEKKAQYYQVNGLMIAHVIQQSFDRVASSPSNKPETVWWFLRVVESALASKIVATKAADLEGRYREREARESEQKLQEWRREAGGTRTDIGGILGQLRNAGKWNWRRP